jgi:coniferyl-aldehyde dehydrogenase
VSSVDERIDSPVEQHSPELSAMLDRHGKAGFDTFSRYRAVVGSDLPFSITGTAAPPFGNSLRFGANVVVRMARLRTHRRLKRRADFA